MNDFEARIGELFTEKMSAGADVISISEVENVINQLGNPKDFDYDKSDEETANQPFAENTTEQSNNNQPKNKKFFRNPNDKLIGGVCSGVAAYFDWNVILVRLGVVALFFIGMPIDLFFFPGWLVVLYIALWIIVPNAVTAEQLLQMRGAPVTLENIGKVVSENVGNKNNFTATSANDKNIIVNQSVSSSNNSGCASTFLKICLIGIGLLILLPVLFALSIVVIVLVAVALGVGTGVLGGLIPWSNDTFLIAQRPELATVGACLLIGIPLFVIIFSIVSAIFKWKPIHKGWKIAGLILWIASIFMLLFSGWKSDFWQHIRDKESWHIGFNGRNEIKGDGNITNRTADFSESIREFKLKNALNIDLQIDSVGINTPGIIIEGDSNLIYNEIEIIQTGEVLTLKSRKNHDIEPTKRISVKLQTDNFGKIDIRGACGVHYTNVLKLDEFEIATSGASNLHLDSLLVNNLNIEVSGASNMDLKGEADNASYNISGAAKINAKDLLCNKIEINASGASYASCYAIESITGKLSGASKLTYSGNPPISNVSTSGMCSVKRE
jgi:phage shock protein PspC (stress-responsive transcriptional regulator)